MVGWIWFIALTAVFLVIATVTQQLRYSSLSRPKICGGCGLGHPKFAAFCRRCGTKL